MRLLLFAITLLAACLTSSRGQDMVIYDDQRQNGWIDYGWASIDYANTTPVHGGSQLRDFLQTNGLTVHDSDGDGKLNADELKQLAKTLQQFTNELIQRSADELGSLQRTAQSLLDAATRLEQLGRNRAAEMVKFQKATQDSQRLAKELEHLDTQSRDVKEHTRELLELMKEALFQSEHIAELTTDLPPGDAAALSLADQARAEDELARWKAGLEQGLNQTPPSTTSTTRTDSFATMARQWV